MRTSTLSFTDRLASAHQRAVARLLAERTAEGVWEGELSSSALSTATATIALSLVDSARYAVLMDSGIQWLAGHQNADGGWGDVPGGLSNISTTSLVNAAIVLQLSRVPTDSWNSALQQADAYLTRHAGGSTTELRAAAIRARYGKDRTFSIPILACCAIAGIVPWREVERLPFELACAPSSFYKLLRLPVVSYALPALIAVGLAIHVHRPPGFWPLRWLRDRAIAKALRKLESIQPDSGGFLEATPLTSFVVMSLVAAGRCEHPVVGRGAEFLVRSARADGSWPIDTHLATWVTTLATNALFANPTRELLDARACGDIRRWLLQQQYRTVHPYTDAAPGGWAWSPLSGGVPDADDTPGALLALHHLGADSETIDPRETNVGDCDESGLLLARACPRANSDLALLAPYDDSSYLRVFKSAADAGIDWLLNLQNGDGGWPTFCRGWGHLPFDRSGADLTAHALRALFTWQRERSGDGTVSRPFSRIDLAIHRGLRYLERVQRPDGGWVPLWFGNEHTADNVNITFGTARVLAAYRDLGLIESAAAHRGAQWLLRAQNEDGSWGGDVGIAGSVEETALAVEALLSVATEPAPQASRKGLEWLVSRIEDGTFVQPATIGFYFAKLWYFEKLYPNIFTVSTLGRALADPQRWNQE